MVFQIQDELGIKSCNIKCKKAENMPKANIDAAIKRASGKMLQIIVMLIFEGKGPHGVFIC